MTLSGLGRVLVLSRGIRRIPGLETLLGCKEIVSVPEPDTAVDAVVGWGHKPTADAARAYARTHGLPYIALEDGFLRSVGIGPREPPLSLVLDDAGIYYDALGPSRLERILSGEEEAAALADPLLLARAGRLRERMVETGVSKYNHTPDTLPAELQQGERYVLVADQTYDDASVTLGLGSAATFSRMLEAAEREHPAARLVLKVHPATVAGLKRGYLAERQNSARVRVIASDVSPAALLGRASHVYVCSSQLGFEALLSGVAVSCFGAPFYAGWGLTRDEQRVARRGRARSLDELVAAALLLYPRYLHPVRRELCEAEDVLEHLALHRKLFAENGRSFVCFGFSRWKRPFVRRYLGAPGNEVRFVRGPAQVAAAEKLTAVVWASRASSEIERWAEAYDVPLWRMEDGFLRSVGLGSDLTAPGSLVLDRRGIYYDPRAESELENILQDETFSPAELERARRLRERIVASGISKYNPFGQAPFKLAAPPGKRIVLVPGQVEDDASVRLGSPEVRDNASLLRAVRRACPEAYVVYKPHPDVLRGNRRGVLQVSGERLWDELVLRVPLPACLAAVHEVHTMTSLVGFEALLRGLVVVTHGQPFYAGWGLTRDLCSVPRRSRRLSLDELVAGALLRYPRYYSFERRAFCTAEDKVFELEQGALRARGRPPLPRLAQRAQSLWLSTFEWVREQGAFRAR